MTPVMLRAGDGTPAGPEGSQVTRAQKKLLGATRAALAAVADDVRRGLLETVGVESRRVEGERCAVALELPAGTDTDLIARAIDLENVEAWCDKSGRLHVAVGPWYSTKDVDQVVLTTTKVVHVLLGLHASSPGPAAGTFGQRLMRSAAEVLILLKSSEQKKG